MNDNLFTPDGRIKGVAFGRASGNRGPVITISRPELRTSVIAEIDFPLQYARVVDRILRQLRIFDDDQLRQRMLNTQPAFLRHYGLTLTPRTIYDLVQAPPP